MGVRTRLELLIFGIMAGVYALLRFFGVVEPIPPLGLLGIWVFALVVLLGSQVEDRIDKIEEQLKRIENKLQ